jgi:nucleotide-binding universal stress UspA family protein
LYINILVPIDGSALSDRAVKEAAGLAKQSGGKMTLFYVAPEYPAPTYSEGSSLGFIPREKFERELGVQAKKLLDRAARKITESGVDAQSKYVSSSSPYDAIVKAAHKDKCDLIVMASHGRRGLAGLVLGSETQKVLTHTRVPVLVVH